MYGHMDMYLSMKTLARSESSTRVGPCDLGRTGSRPPHAKSPGAGGLLRVQPATALNLQISRSLHPPSAQGELPDPPSGLWCIF